MKQTIQNQTPNVITLLSTLFFLTFFTLQVHAQEKEIEIIASSVEVLEDMQGSDDSDIPQAIMDQSNGIIIIPGLKKVGFVIGGRRGHGIAMIKMPDGSWSKPAFVTLTGGSFGFQAGYQSTDIVLLFKKQKTLLDLTKKDGKFTLGGDIAVAAGPVGRNASASTDIELEAEVYSYSRSKGLFAGISIDGSHIKDNDDSNEDYYREFDITVKSIFEQSLAATNNRELQALSRALAIMH